MMVLRSFLNLLMKVVWREEASNNISLYYWCSETLMVETWARPPNLPALITLYQSKVGNIVALSPTWIDPRFLALLITRPDPKIEKSSWPWPDPIRNLKDLQGFDPKWPEITQKTLSWPVFRFKSPQPTHNPRETRQVSNTLHNCNSLLKLTKI